MNNNEDIVARISYLLRKKVFGNLTLEEDEELKTWLDENDASGEWFERIESGEFFRQDYLK